MRADADADAVFDLDAAVPVQVAVQPVPVAARAIAANAVGDRRARRGVAVAGGVARGEQAVELFEAVLGGRQGGRRPGLGEADRLLQQDQPGAGALNAVGVGLGAADLGDGGDAAAEALLHAGGDRLADLLRGGPLLDNGPDPGRQGDAVAADPAAEAAELEVAVGVDETRQQGDVAEVLDLDTRRGPSGRCGTRGPPRRRQSRPRSAAPRRGRPPALVKP